MISMKTIRVIFIGILFCLLFISESSFAQIYKWVDEKGTVNFTDNPNKVPVKYRTTVDTLDINPRESPPPTLSVRPETKSHSDLSETIQNKVAPGRSYYDAHPEERARDAAAQANKPLMDMHEKLIQDMRTREQGFGGGSYNEHKGADWVQARWHGPGGVIYLHTKGYLIVSWNGYSYFRSDISNDASWVQTKWYGPGGAIYLHTRGYLITSWNGHSYFPVK